MPTSPLTEQTTLLVTVLGGLSVVGAALAVGYKSGYRSARKTLNSERNLKRFTEIYAPLVALFITYHITWEQWTSSYSFQERIVNARKKLKRRRRSRLKDAIIALLFSRHVEATYREVEYGGEFPLSEIVIIVRDNAKFADSKLIRLVSESDRSRNEEKPKASTFTDIEGDLMDYIYTEHKKLERRFLQTK